MINILKLRDKITRQARLSIPIFSDCMGCLPEKWFCDTRYRIVFGPCVVFIENNCPYKEWYLTRSMNAELKIHNKMFVMKLRSFSTESMAKCAETVPVLRLKSKVEYSRTSVARTLMARTPRTFRTRSLVPRKNSVTAGIIILGII